VWFGLFAFVYVPLCVTLEASVPCRGGPDEGDHYLYIRALGDTCRLPIRAPVYAGRLGGGDRVSRQIQHPPLYYLVGAVVYRLAKPWGPAATWKAVRGLNIALGVAALYLLLLTARLVLSRRRDLSFAPVVLCALVPASAYLSCVVTNETGAAPCTSAVQYALARVIWLGPSRRRLAALALLLGLGGLTKYTVLVWLPACLCVVPVVVWRARRSWRLVAEGVTTILTVPLAVCGGWFVRNYLLYGVPVFRNVISPPLFPGGLPQIAALPDELLLSCCHLIYRSIPMAWTLYWLIAQTPGWTRLLCRGSFVITAPIALGAVFRAV